MFQELYMRRTKMRRMHARRRPILNSRLRAVRSANTAGITPLLLEGDKSCRTGRAGTKLRAKAQTEDNMEVAQSPLPDAATSQSRGGRIFVQIPAYRDSELSATVRDLVKKAYDPASLRIAVLWQKGPDEEFDPESGRGAELEVVEISHVQSQGAIGPAASFKSDGAASLSR
jgi:hypothetical protein